MDFAVVGFCRLYSVGYNIIMLCLDTFYIILVPINVEYFHMLDTC